MKEYHIYWIKDEFADHYYYKCDLLYRFIQAYQENNVRIDLALQFNYITSNFPMDLLNAIIYKLKKSPSIRIIKAGNNQLDLRSEKSYLKFYINKERLILQCDSLQDAEKILFPSLRGVYPYLFVINPHYNEYGWISPGINKFSIVEEKEILYSYR